MPTDVLLLHAFPLDHTMWEPQIAALSNRFRVIVPDIRGFGTAGPASPWAIEDACDDIATLLSKMNVSDCTVAGLSMGGYIAIPFYAKYSERVRQLVLADTRARADNETEKAGRSEMIAALQSGGIAILPDRMLPRLLQPNPTPAVVGKVRSIIERTDPAAAAYALMAMRDRPDASTVLHRISCPTLVIAGEYDAVTRVEECRAMAETIKGARYVQIPGAGHLSNLENPEAFNRALLEFLVRA
jgi:pimeloyl-ACP methyl ester carboxylesterase